MSMKALAIFYRDDTAEFDSFLMEVESPTSFYAVMQPDWILNAVVKLPENVVSTSTERGPRGELFLTLHLAPGSEVSGLR